jgi:hypothetical protein
MWEETLFEFWWCACYSWLEEITQEFKDAMKFWRKWLCTMSMHITWIFRERICAKWLCADPKMNNMFKEIPEKTPQTDTLKETQNKNSWVLFITRYMSWTKSANLTSCHEFHNDFIVELKLHQIDVPPFHIKISPSALCLVDWEWSLRSMLSRPSTTWKPRNLIANLPPEVGPYIIMPL